MATAKTWLWITLGFIGVCVLAMVSLAGAGLYFVSHHIALQKSTSASALRSFDSARAQFKSTLPLIEIDGFDRPREARPTADLPTSPVRPAALHVLAWDPNDGRLVRIAMPFWLLRLGRRKMDFLDDAHGFDFSSLNLDLPELERIGPALILDHRSPNGERVLIWTE